MSLMQSFGVSQNQPQVIDPRAAYEQQALMADQMAQQATQYTGGGLGEALAMMLNAYGAKKMGERASGSLSRALEQEAEAARQAAEAEANAREQEFQNEIRLAQKKAQIEAANRADPSVIRELRAAGIDPASPEGRKRILEGTGGGPVVNVNSGPQGPQVGTIPQGFQLLQGESGAYRMEPIPGSEADIERQQQAEKQQGREQTREVKQGIMLDEINRALEVVDSNPNLAAGPLGGLGAVLNLGPGNRLESALEGLKPNIAFDRLDEMRQNSPTGGAVGQLSDSEREALSSVFGSLRQTQHPDDLRYNLSRLNNVLVDAQHGTAEQRRRLVESGEIPAALNAQIDSLYMPVGEREQPRQGEQQPPQNDEDALIRKYL